MHNEYTGEVITTTPFSQQLAFLSRGSLDAELTQVLAEVVKAVRDSGKSGAVTLKIKVSMLNERDENAVKLVPEVSTRIPKLAPYESILFSTADGDLLRDDPKQRKLDLREVPKRDPGPLQEVTTRANAQQPGSAPQHAPA